MCCFRWPRRRHTVHPAPVQVPPLLVVDVSDGDHLTRPRSASDLIRSSIETLRAEDGGQQSSTLMRLRSHFKDSKVECPSTKKFIPTNVIKEAITDESVRAIIEEEKIETEDAEQLSSNVSQFANRLFTILLCLRKCQDIVLFLTEGIRDIDLPFMEDEREGYKLQTSTGKSITSFLRWDTSSLKDFYKEQWAVLIFQRLL